MQATARFLPFEVVTEQSFDMVTGSNSKGVLHLQKALPLLGRARLSSSMRPLARGRGGQSTSTVSAAAGCSSRANPQRRLVGRGIRVNTISPGRRDTRCSVASLREQGDAVRASSHQQSQQADGRSVGSAKLASISRRTIPRTVVGAELPDRRRSLSHFPPVGALSFFAARMSLCSISAASNTA